MIITAPNKFIKTKYKSLFLAGGITDCPNWQRELISKLAYIDGLMLFNPRREDFPIDDPNAASEQITWEFDMLRKAGAISFWFPKETLCPIVLYELGAWAMTRKPLFVGCDVLYKRSRDVEIQLSLVRPDVKVVHSLDNLVNQIQSEYNSNKWSSQEL